MSSSSGSTQTRANAIGALAAEATPVLFFTGKGGVGKTSIACAVAVVLADAGRRTLLVSTDPASNLDEVLGVVLSDKPRSRVRTQQRLLTIERAAGRRSKEDVPNESRECKR